MLCKTWFGLGVDLLGYVDPCAYVICPHTHNRELPGGFALLGSLQITGSQSVVCLPGCELGTLVLQ